MSLFFGLQRHGEVQVVPGIDGRAIDTDDAIADAQPGSLAGLAVRPCR
jgi:hypothetical protein